jgi:hypothetical protein
MFLTGHVKKFIRLLLPDDESIYDSIVRNLYNGKDSIVEFSDILPESRKGYVAAFDLDLYTLELIEKEGTGTVKSTILDLDNDPYIPYKCFVNGPFFNQEKKPAYSIGRRKSRNKIIDRSNSEFLSVGPEIQISFPSYISTDASENVIIESEIADEAVFIDSKFFFEGTILFVDTVKGVNHFETIDGVNELMASTLPFVSIGMPFIGVSEYNSKKYLVVIVLENLGRQAFLKHSLVQTFSILAKLTNIIGIKKLVFTDGSSSVFLRYSNHYYFDLTDTGKNEDMPFFIGIREKN